MPRRTARSERCGRPKASELPRDVARPHSLQCFCWRGVHMLSGQFVCRHLESPAHTRVQVLTGPGEPMVLPAMRTPKHGSSVKSTLKADIFPPLPEPHICRRAKGCPAVGTEPQPARPPPVPPLPELQPDCCCAADYQQPTAKEDEP